MGPSCGSTLVATTLNVRISPLGAVALALALWATPSSATVTYQYQGNPFTTFVPPGA